MKPIATFDAEKQTVEIVDGQEHITLRMEVVDAIFEALMEPQEDLAVDDGEEEGVHCPVGIEALPREGELRVIITLEDGSRHVFAFRAPGRSLDHVRGASDSLQECFQRLFAPQ